METLRLPRHRLDLGSTAGGGLLTRALDNLWEWRARVRERRQLSELSDAMLKDIGISRADASTEFEKPFWRS